MDFNKGEKLLERINLLYNEMSNVNKKVANFILNNGADAALFSITNIAREADVSEAAVVRFAKFLGYSGFKDMQEELKTLLKERLCVVSKFQESFQPDMEEKYTVVFKNDLKNIDETFNNLTPELLDEAVEKILKARRIAIVSMRIAAGPALMLEILLNQLRDDVELLTPSYANSFDKIKNWGKEDLIVGISFYVTKNYTCAMMEYGKKLGCQTLALTDNIATSLGQLADTVLPIKTEGPYMSQTAVTMVINTLVYLLGIRLGQSESDSREKIVNAEEMMNRYWD